MRRWWVLLTGSLAAGCVAQATLGTVDPAPDPDVQVDPVAIGASGRSACAVRADGTVDCWGTGFLHESSDGTLLADLAELEDVVEIRGFIEYACALHGSGNVSCWGFSHKLQLGPLVGRDDETSHPVPLPDITDAVALGTGHHHACVIDTSGEVACWGEPYLPALGSPVQSSATPVHVELPRAAVDVDAGLDHTCAVDDIGTVWCWGKWGTGPVAETPTRVDVPIRADRVDAGYGATCVWEVGGEAWCWGYNPSFPAEPNRFSAGPVSTLSLGYPAVCVVADPDGTVTCSRTEADLTGLSDVIDIDGVDDLACALTAASEVACWSWSDETVAWIHLPD